MTDEELFEFDHLESLLDFLPEDKVRNLLASAAQGTTPLLNDMREAVTRSDAVGLHRAGHTAKGMFGNLGMRRCEALSASIEALGREGDFASVPPLIDELKTAAAETVARMLVLIAERSRTKS
jgi:HPt (histidine-containing phosphotransfer) domain-containing protein